MAFDEADVIIDCETCAVRGLACDDCVVSVLLGVHQEVWLDPVEAQALDALAQGGLLPPLRLTPRTGTGG